MKSLVIFVISAHVLSLAKASSLFNCRFENTDLLGGDLSPEEGGHGIITANEETCKAECDRDKRPKCNYWTFVSKWEVNCYLKYRAGDMVELEGAVSGSTGFQTCGVLKTPMVLSTPAKTGCPMPDTSYWGGDLASADGGQGLPTEGHWECSEKCIDAPKCSHWTYVRSKTVNCFLKSKPVQTVSGVKGSISGTYGVGCVSDPLTRKLCYIGGELSTSIFDDKTCLKDSRPFNDGEEENLYIEEKFNGTDWVTSEFQAQCREGFDELGNPIGVCGSGGEDVKTASPTAGSTRAFARPPPSNSCTVSDRKWKRVRGKLRCI